MRTQATNIVGKNSKNNQAHRYSSAQGESNRDLDNLEDIDKLLSQSIPLCLVSLSQNLTANQLLPSTASAITRTAYGITWKKTYQLERLESQVLKDK